MCIETAYDAFHISSYKVIWLILFFASIMGIRAGVVPTISVRTRTITSQNAITTSIVREVHIVGGPIAVGSPTAATETASFDVFRFGTRLRENVARSCPISGNRWSCQGRATNHTTRAPRAS